MFITFEGTEGSGKSTLIAKLAQTLREKGIELVVTREPGGNPVAEAIRNLILNQEMASLTELFLYEAARAEHLNKVILPALQARKWVLCDRFTDSTLAYQGFARKIDLELIEKLNRIASQGLKPDLTFFLDIPVEEGLARATDPNKFEKAGVAFQKKVRAGFLHAVKKYPRRFRVLKVRGKNPDQVCESALKELEKFL